MSKEFNIGAGRFRKKVYAGNLSDLPEVQEFVQRFRKRTENRGNVVNVRLDDDALACIDQLVEATLFGSRSEAAAFLIGAGVESQHELFDRLNAHREELRNLKEKLREATLSAIKHGKA